MNKLIKILSVSVLISGSLVLVAEGFEGEKKDQVKTEKWLCKYCPEIPLWETEIGFYFGYVSDDVYHFADYTGIEENQFFLSGSVKNINPEDGQYWITEFSKLGTDAQQFNSRYGLQGKFEIGLDFQSIPVRKYDQLSTVFTNPGSNSLRLDDNWSRGNNSADFLNSPYFTNFSLGTDWDQLGLQFAYITENNFDYSLQYNRIEKSGLRESSVNQYFQAVYFPMPVNSVTEDFSARIDYLRGDWFGSFAVKFSKFDNNYDAVSFANPFLSLVNGANVTRVADDPSNRAINASFNVRYTYMPRSFVKAYYSFGQMTQDEQFLPYTTNQSLLTPLPQSSLDGEVRTQNLTLKVNHWFNSKLSLRAKYNFRDRYNKTNMQIYRPVISDIFTAAAIINIPYDLTNETSNVDLDWRFLDRQLLSFGIKNKTMQRTFQSIRDTSEDAVTVNYRAYFNSEFQFYMNAEQSRRTGSAAELIDLISVTENPLLQRFNVSDRDHNKLNIQFNYSSAEQPFSAIFSVQYAEDDYDETEIGLQYSWQNNVNLDFGWQLSEDANLALFVEREIRETTLGGSAGFSGRDWLVDNDDEVVSYGLNFAVRELLDEKLDISGSFQLSVADTNIDINNAGSNSQLPVIESLWTVVEIKAAYQYSEQLDFALTFTYQDYESHDFAIDDVIPGAAANLLTFSAMSNNYNLNYLLLSAYYRF